MSGPEDMGTDPKYVHIGFMRSVLEEIQKPDWALPWDPIKYRNAKLGLHDLAAKKAVTIEYIKKQPIVPIPRVLDRYIRNG